MELSIFLAKLIGIYLLIIAVVWVIHKDQVDQSIKDFISSRGLILFAGAVNILAGLAIAIAHPVWELNWRGLITLLAYIMIVQGIMRFAFAKQIQEYALSILSEKYWVVIAIMVFLGGFLTYSGFMSPHS